MATNPLPRSPFQSTTANDRFKSRSDTWLWAGVGLAAGLHFLAFTLAPDFSVADMRSAVTDYLPIDPLHELELPSPPEPIRRPAIPKVAPQELDEDVTITPTTLDANPVDRLPAPPSAETGPDTGPFVTPFTVRPELRDPRAARELVRRAYPDLLQPAGIGGEVIVWAFIDESGSVRDAQVSRSSGVERLDEAALRAARQFEYRPAMNLDRRVPVWIRQKITFAVK